MSDDPDTLVRTYAGAINAALKDHGNLLSYEEQWRKLERIVEVAQDVWG